MFYRAGDEFHFSSNDAHTLYAVWLHPGDPDPENAAGGDEGGSEAETASLFSAGQVDPTMVPMMMNTLVEHHEDGCQADERHRGAGCHRQR